MTYKIEKKITGYKVLDKLADQTTQPQDPTLETMNEFLARPDFLIGTTYKIKTPSSEHAMYITINDMILNEGTADESKHPYEMFINSKKRSLSVNDIVCVNGTYYQCLPYGWKEVTTEYVINLENEVSNHPRRSEGAWFALSDVMYGRSPDGAEATLDGIDVL